MLRILLVALFASVALCQQPYNENYEDEEILVPAAVLPPHTLVRARRQAFGGISHFPTGGFSQTAGFRTPTTGVQGWGSLSQNFDKRGFSSPISYNGGLDLRSATPGGNSLSLSGSHIPKLGSQASLAGNLNLVNTPNHNLNTFASHTKTYDKNFHPAGPGTTNAGVGYTHTTNDGNTQFSVTGSRAFTPGVKPTNNIEVGVSHSF